MASSMNTGSTDSIFGLLEPEFQTTLTDAIRLGIVDPQEVSQPEIHFYRSTEAADSDVEKTEDEGQPLVIIGETLRRLRKESPSGFKRFSDPRER